MQQRLKGPENRALGAIKEVVFEEPDLPEEREAAIEYLEGVKDEVLSDDVSDTEGEET
jgi:poly(A) polymerase